MVVPDDPRSRFRNADLGCHPKAFLKVNVGGLILLGPDGKLYSTLHRPTGEPEWPSAFRILARTSRLHRRGLSAAACASVGCLR